MVHHKFCALCHQTQLEENSSLDTEKDIHLANYVWLFTNFKEFINKMDRQNSSYCHTLHFTYINSEYIVKPVT